MKKITFIIGSLRGGGAEKVCVTLANALSEKGHHVDLVVLNLTNAIRQQELSKKVKLINLDIKHTRYSFLPLLRYIKQSRPSKILSFNRQISVILGFIKYLISFELISRNIIFLSEAEKFKKGFWHGFLSKNLTKIMYPRSDVIIAQSIAMKADLIAHLKISSEKIIVINNPINQSIEKFNSSHNTGDTKTHKSRENYILCVGRLDKQKGFTYALQAFSLLSSKFPEIRLKIVGQGPEQSALKKLSRDLNIHHLVDFEGYQQDLIPYYINARLTLLTSLFEGFPNVLIESIALGTPVVSFNCPSGPSEIVLNNVNGYLVNLRDVEQLNEKIATCLTRDWIDADIRNSASRFSLNTIVKKYERVL